jgi:RNA polymerase sigma-70 factor, ECF subfamily
MSSGDSFPQLLARVRAGDDAAAAVIFQRFVDRLAAHAHQRLSPVVRRQIDAEDIVQSVYRTFFRRVRQGQFRVDHWGSLWGLLTRITFCKCARAANKVRGGPRENSLRTNSDSSAFDSGLDWEAIAREPSPAEAAALNDTLDALLEPLGESHREILRLALQGYTQAEIGNRVGCSERTVRRVLTQAQADLKKMQPLGAETERGN